MSIYAIGDLQGCFTQLQALLEHIHFNPDADTLWFTGDLVNRGPASLEVLRFVKGLGDKHITILGNHDLHLLATAYGVRELNRNDTLDEIFKAPDKEDLLQWLRSRPLLHRDLNTGYIMTHAGLAPAWSSEQACELAREVEVALQGSDRHHFLREMYGNLPDAWADHLTGYPRLRCIVNYLTRMRLCYADGRMDFAYKGNLANKPADLIPWFDVSNRKNADAKVIFGHWAALDGCTDVSNVYALDTGCVWGRRLTAMRLEDEQRFSVPCSKS